MFACWSFRCCCIRTLGVEVSGYVRDRVGGLWKDLLMRLQISFWVCWVLARGFRESLEQGLWCGNDEVSIWLWLRFAGGVGFLVLGIWVAQSLVGFGGVFPLWITGGMQFACFVVPLGLLM